MPEGISGDTSLKKKMKMAPEPKVEGLSPEIFKWGIGKIATDLEDLVRAQQRPTDPLIAEAYEDSRLQYRLVPIKRREGQTGALKRTLGFLKQDEILQRINDNTKALLRGDREYNVDTAELEYTKLSNVVSDGELQEGLGHIAFQLSLVLTVKHDPELVKDATANRNSREALDLAEVSGKVEGYTSALEFLSPDHLMWAQEQADRVYKNMVDMVNRKAK